MAANEDLRQELHTVRCVAFSTAMDMDLSDDVNHVLAALFVSKDELAEFVSAALARPAFHRCTFLEIAAGVMDRLAEVA